MDMQMDVVLQVENIPQCVPTKFVLFRPGVNQHKTDDGIYTKDILDHLGWVQADTQRCHDPMTLH
jgi:hypothetical protein